MPVLTLAIPVDATKLANWKQTTDLIVSCKCVCLYGRLPKANTRFLCVEQAANFCPCRNVSLRWQGLSEDRIIFLTLPGSAVQELFRLTMNCDQAKRLPPAHWSNGHLRISRGFLDFAASAHFARQDIQQRVAATDVRTFACPDVCIIRCGREHN